MSSVLTASTASTALRTPSVAPPVAARAAPASVPLAAKLAAGEAPVATPEAAKPTPEAALSKDELAQAVQLLQAKMDKLNPALAFVLDQDSGRAMIQLTDRATKEVIQQFPSEAAMRIAKALDHFEKGKLVHRMA